MKPQITVTEDLGAVAGEAIALAIHEVVSRRGQCCLALSGGSAPGPVMEWLAKHLSSTLLGKLVITWIDERHVPLPEGDDWRALPEASNLRLAWEHWLSRVPEPPPLVPMARPGTLHEATQAFAEAFTAAGGRVDVALLGVGPDGHIASLFPGHPALQATGVCVAVEDSPKPPPQRLSLTLPVLQDVDHAVLVAAGAAKADALQAAHGGDESIPLGRYQPRGAWHWVIDPAAAARLPHQQDDA